MKRKLSKKSIATRAAAAVVIFVGFKVWVLISSNALDLADDALRIGHDFALAASPWHEPPERGLVGRELREYMPMEAYDIVTHFNGRGHNPVLQCDDVGTVMRPDWDERSVELKNMTETEEIISHIRKIVVDKSYPDPSMITSNEDVAFFANLFALANESGIGDEVEAIRRAFLASYTPSQEYSNWENIKFEAVIGRLIVDEELMVNLDSWVKPRQFKNGEHAAEQYWLRQKALQYIADNIRAEFGLPPLPVMVKLEPVSTGRGAFYNPEQCSIDKDSMEINYNDWLGILDNPEDVMRTIMHELKHSIDYGLAKAFQRGKLGSDHIAYQHAAVYVINKEKYLSLIPPDSVMGIPYSYKDNSAHSNQYIERIAYEHAERFGWYLPYALEEYREQGKKEMQQETPSIIPVPSLDV